MCPASSGSPRRTASARSRLLGTRSAIGSPATSNIPGSADAGAVGFRRSRHASTLQLQLGQWATPSSRLPNVAIRLARSKWSRTWIGSVASSLRVCPRNTERIDSARSIGCSRSARSVRASSCWASGMARTRMRASGGERRLGRLGHRCIALPPLVLELQMLDRHGVGIGIEVRRSLVLRHPAAEHLVGDDFLSRLVIDLDDHVLAEVLERDLRSEPCAEIPDLVGPGLEIGVVGDAALERDCFELRAPGGLAGGARVPALAVLDYFGRALERAHLAHPCDIAAVPFHAELEVLVGIKALRIDTELRHRRAPQDELDWAVSCWICSTTNSAGRRGAKPIRMFTTPMLW